MIRHLHNQLIRKEISATELSEQYLERIEKLDPKIRAFLTVTAKEALNKAREVDEKIARGEKIAPIAGIPAAIKDNIITLGVKTTAASRILENYVPRFDATVIERLRERDFVMVGKTNLDEFAHGSSTENSAFWTTRNPWNLERVPGGSSGGSAAAVCAQMAVYALGTDTGGSIRQPASYCGIVGLKPTYGLLSRYGLVAMTSSTDVPGFLTRTVEDAAYLLSALAGQDPKDATTLPKERENYARYAVHQSVKGVRIGIPKEYFIEGLDKEVESAVKSAVETLGKQGADVKEISLPYSPYGIAVYYVVTPSEVSSNLGRFDGIRYGFSKHKDAEDLIDVYYKSRGEGFGSEAKRRIMIGTYALSSGYYDAYYKKAQKVRTLIIDDFKRAFDEVDVIITPSAPGVAFKIGSKANDPLAMYLEDIFAVPVSLAGLPAMSIPCGFNRDNLPIGMQIIASHLCEPMLLKIAECYEAVAPEAFREPPLLTKEKES